MNRTAYLFAALLCGVVSYWAQPGAAACLDQVIVRPVGRITDVDGVRLQVKVSTPTLPAHHEQPPQVDITGNDVLIRP